MPYDASNRRDVKAAEKQAKVAEQQRREVVTGIMSVAPGRSWMCDILEHCHIFATSYNDVANRMAFMEGQREVGHVQRPATLRDRAFRQRRYATQRRRIIDIHVQRLAGPQAFN